MPDGTQFLASLREHLHPDIALGADDPRLPPFGLMPGELLYGAVPSRMSEFAAGRRAARIAIAGLGMEPALIAHGPDRAPIWPDGATGSISHCADLCVAIAGRGKHWAGLGIDIEPAHDLDPSLWSEVLRREERDWLETLAKGDQGLAALSIFIAKEAVYKAQYATSRTLFGFDALNISMSGAGFAATFMRDVPCFTKGSRIWGGLVREGGYLAAVCPLYQDWFNEQPRALI